MQIRKIFGLGLFVLTAGNPLASSAHEGRATCQLGPVDIDQSGVVDVSDLTLVLLNMGAKGHPADVNGDGWVDVDDLMAVILHWGESCALGQFINPPAQYVLQSGVALSFGMNTPPAPAGAYVIFQTWSDAAQAIQAVHTDSAPPFVYPATALNGVTPGSGIMQAIVRSPSHQTLGVISAPAAQFIAPGGPPSAPEITVAIAGSGVSIPNGQVTPIDFGVVNLGAPAPSVVIRVRNDGNAPLTLGSVSVPAGFSMIEGLTASLAPGSNDTFTVQMNTGAPGGYSGQISIANNDADENPFHFAIAGTVQSPPGGGGPSPTGCAIAAAVGGLSGMAPFTVHVNAIHNCNLNAGNITTAQYDWDFGDPTGAFNRISSYGGAHVYEAPGTYTVSVRITNEAGGWVQRTATVNVSANTRARIYVANNGSNANSGASPSDPRATISSVPSNTEVFFRRGDTFGGFTMNGSTNARASAYGTGARPRITGQVTADGTSLMLEEMNFYPSGTINQSIRVTNANGVTIRNNSGQSGGGDYFIEAPLSTARGILVQGNTLGVLGGYLFWGNGSHYSIFGNTLQDSLNQHGVRYYADYVYVIGNDLGNPGNNAISIATSNYSYVAKNILRGDGHDGAWIGYVDDGGPRSAHNVVFEGNLLMNAEVKIHPGDNIVLRNNIIHRGKAYIIGYDVTFPDPTLNGFKMVHNTIVDPSAQYSNCVYLKSNPQGADNLIIANNLCAKPAMVTGDYKSALVFAEVGSELAGIRFQSNLWSIPAVVNYGIHYVAPAWGNPGAYRTIAQWDAYAQTADERHRTFNLTQDFDSQWRPLFSGQDLAAPLPGVFRDYYGNPRPAGSVRVGAVE